jgi:AsmA-like protein
VRRALVIAAIAAGVVGLGFFLAIVNLGRIVDANRARILAEVSAAVGRPVEVDRIGVSLRGGLGVRLERLRIADDPAFSTGDVVRAEAVQMVVRLWPLLRRELAVRRIIVESPRVSVIQTPQGTNTDTLGRRSGADPRPGGPTPGAAPDPVPSDGALPLIAIALVSVRDGAVRVDDRRGPKPVVREIAPLDVTLSDLSLATPMTIRAAATVAGDVPTQIAVHGSIGPIGDPPLAADVPLDLHVSVRGPAITLPEATVSGQARRDAAGRPFASLRVGAPRIESGGAVVEELHMDCTERERVASLDHLGFRLLGGTVEGTGRVEHGGDPPRFTFTTAVRGVDLEQALALRDPDAARRITGRLDADWSFAGTAGDDAAVRRSLTGTGHVEVHEGALRDVNLVDGVLSGVTGVGGLTTLAPERVRQRHPDIFATGDTRFDRLGADVVVGGERITMNPFVVAAHDYEVRGTGTVTFAQQADLTATLTASAGLTTDLTGAVRQARYLVDDAGRLSIPFRLVGTLPNVKPRPDAAFVERVLQRALAGEGLGGLLGGDQQGADDGKGGKHGGLLRDLGRLLGR